MLSFSFEEHCYPAQTMAWAGSAEQTAEGEGLVVLLVRQGHCLAGGLPLGVDRLLAAPAPLAVAPAGHCQLAGARLAGRAASQLAAALGGPVVFTAGQCPGGGELLLRLAQSGGRMPPAEASAEAYALVCRIAAAQAGQASIPPLVAAALAEMQAHYGEVYGIEELASQLEVSKSHLIRRFTAAMGMSPGKYLSFVRIENAKRLLATSGLPLDIIASLCGLSGANYLCKLFKKETGESPAAWRKRAAPAHSAAPTELEEQLYL